MTPSVAPYTVDADLGNVENLWQLYALQYDQEIAEKLAKNGFVVCGSAGTEFFEIYENNRYEMIPNFVTVDSLMHTYHLYFAYLLKNIEKNDLSERVSALGRRMLDDSIVQYEQLKGSEWESAAKRNVAFFTVGAKLLDDSAAVNADVAEIMSLTGSVRRRALRSRGSPRDMRITRSIFRAGTMRAMNSLSAISGQ